MGFRIVVAVAAVVYGLLAVEHVVAGDWIGWVYVAASVVMAGLLWVDGRYGSDHEGDRAALDRAAVFADRVGEALASRVVEHEPYHDHVVLNEITEAWSDYQAGGGR